MTNAVYITDVSGRGYDETDKDRAVEAAEAALAGVDAKAAQLAFIAKVDGEDHDTALAAAWEKAQSAADRAFTEGWANPEGGYCFIGAE